MRFFSLVAAEHRSHYNLFSRQWYYSSGCLNENSIHDFQLLFDISKRKKTRKDFEMKQNVKSIWSLNFCSVSLPVIIFIVAWSKWWYSYYEHMCSVLCMRSRNYRLLIGSINQQVNVAIANIEWNLRTDQSFVHLCMQLQWRKRARRFDRCK